MWFTNIACYEIIFFKNIRFTLCLYAKRLFTNIHVFYLIIYPILIKPDFHPDDPDYDKYAKPSKPQDNRRENDQRDHEKSSSHRGSYRDECHDKIKEEGRKEKDRHRDHDKSRNNDKRDGRDTEDRDRDRRQKEKHKDDYSSERRGEKDSHRDKNYQNEKRRTSKEKHDHEPKDMWVGPKDEKWSQRMKHFLNEMVDYMDYLKKKGGKDAKYYEAKKKWEKENQKYDEFLKSKDKHKSQTDHHNKNDGGKSPSSKKEEKRQQRSESRAETTKTGTATETEATTQDSSDEDMNIVIGKNSVKFNGFSSDSSLSSDEERSKKQSGKKKRTGTTEEPVLPKIAKMTMPEPMGDNNVVPNQMVHPLVLPNGQVIPPGFQIPGLNTPFHFPGLPAYPNLPGLGYHQQMQQQAVVAAQSNNQILVQPPPVVPAPLVQTPQPVASAVPAPPLPVTSTFNSSSLRTLNRVQIDEADLKATMNESPDKIILSSAKGSIDYDLLKQKSDRVICLKGLKDDVPDRFFYGYKKDVQSALEAKYGIKIDQFLGSAGRKVGYIVLGSANEADLLYKKEGYRLKELNTTVTFYRFKGRHKKDVSPERKVEDSGNKSVPNFTVKIQNDDSSTKLAPESIKINVNNNLAKPNSTNSIMNQLADSLRKSRQTVAIDHQKRANITMTSSQEELLDMALAPQAAVTTGKIKQETPTSQPQQQHQPVAQAPTNLPKMLPAKLMAVNTQANTSRILDPSLYEKPIKAKTEAPLPAAPEPAYIPKIRTSHNTRVTQGLLPTSERFAKIQLKDEQQSDERLKESNSQEESAPIRLDKHGRPVRISSNAYSRKPELDRETTNKNIKQEIAQPEQAPQEAIKPISKPEPKANNPIKAEVNQEPTPAEPSPKNDKGISQANNSLFMDKSLDLSARIKNNPPPLANYAPNGKVEPLIKTEVAQKPQPVLSNEEAQKQALMYLQKEREKQLQQQHRDPRFGTTQNFAQNWQSQPYQAALLPGAPPGPPQGGYQMPPPSQPMNTNGPWGNNNLSNKKYNKVEDMFRELESETTKMSKDKIPQQKINLLGVDIPDQYFKVVFDGFQANTFFS